MRSETPEEPTGQNGHGCAFVLDDIDADPARSRFCDATRQAGSTYCPHHHALCRLARGSAAEKRQLREIDALARVVGGRQGRVARQPPAGLLRRLDRVAQAALRLDCSPIVPGETDGATANPRQGNS